MRSFIAVLTLAFAAFAAQAQEKALSPLWVGPAFSGSWYTPERSGEGFILQVLENGTALLLWFTYPPAGAPAQQAWIYADAGAIDGERIRFSSAITTRGGRFGAASGGATVQRIPWGTVEFRFTSCNEGEVTYAGPDGWGSGTRRIVRLTELAELGCTGKRGLAASGARAADGLRQRSAAWFNPMHDGEGWAYEELADGRALLYWFTYDATGEQAWTYGEAAASGERASITNLRPVGTRFGAGFDATRVSRTAWGNVELAFVGCDRATLGYVSSDVAFGSGAVAPQRLSILAGSACLAQKPEVPATGAWSTGTTMPIRHSEVGAASIGTRTCVAGGFTSSRDFQCYDAANNAWTVLPQMPAGRDHGEAFAFNGDFYFGGGDGELAADGAVGWRFRFDTGRWETVAEFPQVSVSSATMLNGFAYLGVIGGVYQFDPRTRRSRFIPGDGRASRDHSQLVAFQGELWFMGGRGFGTGAHALVSIFDPASETWRVGPTLNERRSGFAAAASATHIFVSGGERLETPSSVVASAEAIAAGDANWTRIPTPPVAVHGVGAAIHGNAFYSLGGSRVAGSAVNFGDVQIYRFGP
jgi:hypothetical protein